MNRIIISLVPLFGAIAGAWLVRSRGWRHLWLAAFALACGLALFGYYVSWLTLVEGNPNGFGSAGVTTRWYPLAIITMAAILHLSSWRRMSKGAGTIVGVILAWLAWEFVTAYSFWIS